MNKPKWFLYGFFTATVLITVWQAACRMFGI